MLLHSLFGMIFTDSALTPEVMNDPVALAQFVDEMSLGGLIGVLVAHQTGALCGAITGVLITKRAWTGWLVGGIFLVFGTIIVLSIPHPMWLAIADLGLYLPMGWLAIVIVLGKNGARIV